MTSKISGIIESMLFAAGEPVSKSMLSEILEISEKEVAEEIEKINSFYKKNLRGFKIIEIDESYQLCTIEENYSYIQGIVAPKRKLSLSPAAMETLSIVAYNQPVTRGSIEYIRGVNSDGPVNKLVEQFDANIVGQAAILAEGDAADRDDIIFLEKLPCFHADGTEI